MRTKNYVGIGADGKRKVFRSATTPEAETHGSIYSAVIGPFRTKKAAEIMRDFGAGNPHMQTVADAERIAKENHIGMQTLYVASAWWRENDAFVTVAGNSARLVEKQIFKAMRNAAIDEYNNSDADDKRTVRSFLNEIAWSGVNTFAFDAIVPQDVIASYEESYSTQADTVAHNGNMDYSDYSMLRDGRKDVFVYLPTA
jgi:hypothetical protein